MYQQEEMKVSGLTTLFLFITVMACIALSPIDVWARPDGTFSSSGEKGKICTTAGGCHFGGTTPTVTLTGPTSLAPGTSATYTFTITGGAAVVGGLDVSTTAGTLQASDSNTQKKNGEITHSSPVAFSNGSLSFTITLIAPSTPGPLTIYAAGLSGNDDGFETGDDAAGTTLTVNVTGQSAPHIVITDSVTPVTDQTIPFGDKMVGTTLDQTITLTNSGNADLVIGTIGGTNPLAAPFAIHSDTCSSQTLTPSASCTLSVRFSPTTAGPASDSFDVPSNDTSTPSATVSVSGNGTPVPVPHIIVTDSVAPVADQAIPFGDKMVGTTPDQTVTLTNSGNADLIIGTIGGTNPLAVPFSIQSDTCSGHTLTPSASCTLTVQFAPASAGSFNDSFDIPSNDPDTSSTAMAVSGTGTSSAVPDISVTDSVTSIYDHQVPFSNVTVNQTLDQTVTIANSGNASLVIGTIGAPALPFTIITDNCSGKTIAPARICTLAIRFTPTAVGSFSGTFDIPNNDPDTATVTISVSGTGTATPVPNIAVTDGITPDSDLQMPFGKVTEGVSSPEQYVTISNTGTAPLLASLQLSGADVDHFTMNISRGSNPCGSTTPTIEAGGNCTIGVMFSPGSTGGKNATIAISSNDPDKATVNVSLTGTGLSALTNNAPSAPTPVFPANVQTGVGTTVQFRWKKSTDPDGDKVTYHLSYCADQTFTSCSPVNIESSGTNKIYFAGIGMYGGLMIFGMVFTGIKRVRKHMLLLIITTALFAGALLPACSTDIGNDSVSRSATDEMTYTASRLISGTKYYWKVVADDGKGGLTESAVLSFITQ